MNLQDWHNVVSAAAIFVLGLNSWLTTRELERIRERHAALTRRVWVLEGSPECECCKRAEATA